MRRLAALLLVLLLALAHCCAAHKINRLRGANENTWNCTSISKTMLVPGAIWQKMNCTSEWLSYEPIGPLTFNVVSADLSAPNLRVVPVMANQSVQYGLQSIPDMGSQRSSLFAGINGGFFWELYNPTFIDNVCLGKSRKDAETPPSLSSPQYGPGDTLLIIDGVLHGSNCHSILFDVPIVFVMNGTSSYIQKLPDGGSLPLSVGNALACGPNLVSFDPTVSNESFIDIPLNDFDPNVWEHAADTAIGLTGSIGPNNAFVADTFYMVTVDGYDSGSVFSPESGINSHELAHYMKYYLNVQMAMNMDQGMWIKGQPNNGVVSNAYTNDPGHGLRIVYNGIFLETVDNE